MWLLALKAMLADRGKLLTSLLGVVFSVVLVNLQGGLLLGMIQKASLLVDYGRADIWVGHRHTTNVDMGTFIPERWIYRIRGIEGVERAEPYVVMFGQMTMPDGKFENVVIIGSEAGEPDGQRLGHGRRRPPARSAIPMASSWTSTTPHRLGNCRIGDVREINGRRAKIVGMTKGIVSFTTNPYLFTTLDRARTKFGGTMGIGPDQCSYFLVKAKPGVDIPTSAPDPARVPELDVYDRRTYSWICMEFWLTRTGIGISFGLAAFLGLLVGLAVVAQTLYASVTERIKEFGTLKAMGANDRSVVLLPGVAGAGQRGDRLRARPRDCGRHRPGDELAARPRRLDGPRGRAQRRADGRGLPGRRLAALLADPADRPGQRLARRLRDAKPRDFRRGRGFNHLNPEAVWGDSIGMVLSQCLMHAIPGRGPICRPPSHPLRCDRPQPTSLYANTVRGNERIWDSWNRPSWSAMSIKGSDRVSGGR